jgi:hypothetical protein
MLALTITAIVAGALAGFARGGSLERLSRITIHLPWLAAIAWLLQVLLFGSVFGDALDPFTVPLHLGTMALVGVVILANRRSPGLALLGLGLILNALVVVSNGGSMPVADSALYAVGRADTVEEMRAVGRIQKTSLMQPGMPLWFLGDVLPFPPLRRVYSVGDLVAGLGVLTLVVVGMGARQRSASAAT